MKRKDILAMSPVEAFEAGYEDYYAGDVPKGWAKPDANDNPYLAGWNIAANQENCMNFYAVG